MVKTIYEQTGWKGILPVSICQDSDALNQVTEFDYVLPDPAFFDYCQSRLGNIKPHNCPWYWEMVMDHRTTRQSYINAARGNARYLRSGERVAGQEILLSWKTYCIQRAKIQDCWEIYTGRR